MNPLSSSGYWTRAGELLKGKTEIPLRGLAAACQAWATSKDRTFEFDPTWRDFAGMEGRNPEGCQKLAGGRPSRPPEAGNPHPFRKPQRGDIFVAQGKRRRSAALGQTSYIKPPSPRSGRRRSITTPAPRLLWPFAWQANAISKDTMFELSRRGEILPDGRTNQDEAALIAAGSGAGGGQNSKLQHPSSRETLSSKIGNR